jgi:arylformamidase
MAEIDYEAEYNNRARVPEHPQIFARGARDAENYRAETLSHGRAELGLAYGDRPREVIDLFWPQAGNTAAPLAMFVHGGYWVSMDPGQYSHLARGLNARGIGVAVVGYDLCPVVTIGDIVGQIRRAVIFLWQRLNRRIAVYGHSAGGHLTAAMVATDWRGLYPKAPDDLVAAGYAISGLFDLEPLIHVSLNENYKLDAVSARQLSPLYWPVKPGRVLDAVVGDLESSEFKRQSRIVADTWEQHGVETRYTELPGNHFTVLEPLTDPESAMVRRIADLTVRFSH